MRQVLLHPHNVTEAEFLAKPGIGALSALSAYVIEDLEAPSAYHATVTVPVGDRLASQLVDGAVLGIPCVDGMEPFRVTRVRKTLTTITAEAWHITYDLRNGLIENRAWEGHPLSAVWQDILEAGGHTEFHGTSTITRTGSVRIVRRSVWESIVGSQDNSVVSRWGGEVSRTGWTVDIQDRRGVDRDWQIRYGRNLTGIDDDVDSSETYHAVLPTYLVGDTAKEMTIQKCPGYDLVARPRTVAMHFGDVRVGEGEGTVPTEQQAEQIVADRIALMWVRGAHKPRASCSVEFVDLERAGLTLDWSEDVRIGDRIRAIWEHHVDIEQRVVRTEWDALAGRWTKIVLGQPARNMAALRGMITEQFEETYQARTAGLIESVIASTLLLNETYVNAAGYYPTTVWNEATGARMTYIHDAPALEDSTFIAVVPEPGTYLWTDQGWNDGDPVWTQGMTKDGNALTRYLQAVGINAEWILLQSGDDVETAIGDIRHGQDSLSDALDETNNLIESLELPSTFVSAFDRVAMIETRDRIASEVARIEMILTDVVDDDKTEFLTQSALVIAWLDAAIEQDRYADLDVDEWRNLHEAYVVAIDNVNRLVASVDTNYRADMTAQMIALEKTQGDFQKLVRLTANGLEILTGELEDGVIKNTEPVVRVVEDGLHLYVVGTERGAFTTYGFEADKGRVGMLEVGNHRIRKQGDNVTVFEVIR